MGPLQTQSTGAQLNVYPPTKLGIFIPTHLYIDQGAIFMPAAITGAASETFDGVVCGTSTGVFVSRGRVVLIWG